MPPALFVRVITRGLSPLLPSWPSSASANVSLFSEPKSSEPAKPEPNSTPFTDGIENMAELMSDSREPNMGSPSPTGTPVVTDCMMPPIESAFFFVSIMTSLMAAAASGSGHLTSLPYIVASSYTAAAMGPPRDEVTGVPDATASDMVIVPTCETYERVSTSSEILRSFRAIAPPITHVAVSLPENLPLTLGSLKPPYFTMVV